MERKVLLFVLAGALSFCSLARGDFKYVQTSQITGGALGGMMKGLGVFSKSARQATHPSESTTYVKGNNLRTENADGTYQIIDLNGRRFITVNPAKQTYSVMTFEQMREFMQEMQQRMSEGMKKQNQQQNTNVTVTPKISVSATGKTQNFLGQDAQEMIVDFDLAMQGTDAQNQPQSGTLRTEIDSWVAPSVIGYHEVSDFYKKMAAEIGWAPGSLGMDPRMKQSMSDLYKSGKMPVGLPMMMSISMLGAPQSGNQSSTQQQQQQQQRQSSESAGDVASPSGMAVKALGGMFGRHRKKQQEEEQQQNPSQPQTTTPSNSLLTITSRVTSFSTDSVDASLFQLPSGYTQAESDMQRSLERKAR
ncbi:MAG: hypothetical protein ACRD3D_12040 [Terriglobia bacterium]